MWEIDSLANLTTTSYYISEIYINEEDLNGINSNSAINNLSAGDTITFNVSYTVTPP
jgi:hypothetical protein